MCLPEALGPGVEEAHSSNRGLGLATGNKAQHRPPQMEGYCHLSETCFYYLGCCKTPTLAMDHNLMSNTCRRLNIDRSQTLTGSWPSCPGASEAIEPAQQPRLCPPSASPEAAEAIAGPKEAPEGLPGTKWRRGALAKERKGESNSLGRSQKFLVSSLVSIL